MSKEERCRSFVEIAKKDNNKWVLNNVPRFLQIYKKKTIIIKIMQNQFTGMASQIQALISTLEVWISQVTTNIF
jgi:hypothetical protein